MPERKGYSEEIIIYFVIAVAVAALALFWVTGKFKATGIL